MIHCERIAAGAVVAGELAPGAAAYVDADWLPADTEAAIPALVVHTDGSVAWGGSSAVALPGDADGVDAVASAWLRLAREASLAVPESAHDDCEVPGHGLVAAWVRRLLDLRADRPAQSSPRAPRAIVETRGDDAAVAAATRRLADLGTLVLAGESSGGSLPLDLYPDVHVRGLRIVGVTPITAGPVEGGAEDRVFLAAFPGLVTDVRLGSVLPLGALCYRLLA